MTNGLSLMQEFQLTSHFYRDLCNTREVRKFINNWVELSFCVLQKFNKKNFPNIPVELKSIFGCWEALTLTTPPYCCSEPTGPALY